MPLSSSGRLSPSEVALQARTAGQWHDVVVAASKLHHGASLDAGDRTALQWAGAIIRRAAATDAVFSTASVQQLVNSGQTLDMLRVAAEDASEEQAVLAEVQDGIRRALRGDTDKMVLRAMDLLRQIFASASRGSLRSQVQAHDADDPVGPWAISATSSNS